MRSGRRSRRTKRQGRSRSGCISPLWVRIGRLHSPIAGRGHRNAGRGSCLRWNGSGAIRAREGAAAPEPGVTGDMVLLPMPSYDDAMDNNAEVPVHEVGSGLPLTPTERWTTSTREYENKRSGRSPIELPQQTRAGPCKQQQPASYLVKRVPCRINTL